MSIQIKREFRVLKLITSNNKIFIIVLSIKGTVPSLKKIKIKIGAQGIFTKNKHKQKYATFLNTSFHTTLSALPFATHRSSHLDICPKNRHPQKVWRCTHEHFWSKDAGCWSTTLLKKKQNILHAFLKGSTKVVSFLSFS